MVKAIRNKGLAIVLTAVTAMASLGMTSTISHAETASGELTISTQTQMDNWISGTDYKDSASVVTLAADLTASAPVTEFAGTFDGDSHTITLALDTTTGNTAFIGTLASTGKVKNVTFDGSVKSSTTGDYVAAAVALNQGLVNKVTNEATVEATAAYNVGGIVGYNDNYSSDTVGVVENSKNKAAVSGKSKTGGIVGENAGTVSSCSNTGDIRSYGGGKDGTGGIVGRNGNNNTAVETGIVKDCYNTGIISDKSATGTTGRWVGGLVGFQNSLSLVQNSYNSADSSLFEAYKDVSATIGNNESTKGSNYYGSAVPASTLTTSDNAGMWVEGSTPGELTYSANETNEPVEVDPVTATDFYLGGTAASDSNTGVASDAAVATLAKAVDLANTSTATAKTIHVLGTVDVTGSDKVFADSGITAKWEGSADTMFDVTGSLTLGGLTVEGNGVATMFAVENGGALKIRNNADLSGAVAAVDVKAGGDLLINRSSIAGTTYSVKLADSTSTCTMSVGSGQEIALSGRVYLGTGATMTMAANPATMLTNVITVQPASSTSNTVIATASDITFDSSDKAMFKLYSSLKTLTYSASQIYIA